MRITILLLIVVLLSSCSARKRIIAMDHVHHIKEGALLVRLQSNKTQREIINKYANKKWKEEIEENLAINNEDLMEGFTDYFDFCNVYFFDSDDARAVAKGDFSKVYDSEGEIIDQSLAPKKFLILGIGNRIYDTAFNRDHVTAIVMDTSFVQLDKPFPWELRFGKAKIDKSILPFVTQEERRSLKHVKNVVEYFNEKLQELYDKSFTDEDYQRFLETGEY